MTEAEFAIPVAGAVLAATLATPDSQPAPGVLLLGGTFSDLRDGDPDPRYWPDIPPHGMYRVLAENLVTAGFAVLRFDRRGCGGSTGSRPDRKTEVVDALAAWDWLARRPNVGGAVAIVGESAGAYVLCRLIAAGGRPSAAVLQGALHRSIAGLIAFNAGRARAFWSRGEEAREWLWTHANREYVSAVLGEATIGALEQGQTTVAVDDERGHFERDLADLDYDVRYPPAEQFRYVECPVLVLHGADDLNVPVEDAFETVRELWAAGNRDVELHVLPRADHSMQSTPDDPEVRLRERMTFASFLRPFHARYPTVVSEYLRHRVLGS